MAVSGPRLQSNIRAYLAFSGKRLDPGMGLGLACISFFGVQGGGEGVTIFFFFHSFYIYVDPIQVFINSMHVNSTWV